MDSDVDLARRAALAGASVAMRHFHALARLPIEEKPDGSVVTEAGGDVTFLDGPTHPALFTCGSGFREAALSALGRADPKSDAGFRWDSD